MSRFDYIEYDDKAKAKQAEFKDIVEAFEAKIEELLPFDKSTIANKTKAINHLEICYMWIRNLDKLPGG